MKLFLEDIAKILYAVPTTLGMAFVILLGGIVLGTAVAAGKTSGQKALTAISRIYISYIRGIPLIVHIYILYYLLPSEISNVFVLIVAYTLYSAACQAENVRTAINSVPKGQYEAAYCVGMSKPQAFFRIILPQAMTVLLPILLNVYLGIIKGLSLAFTISVVDILAQAKLCSAENFAYIQAYLAAAVVYWGICIGLTAIFNKLEAGLYRKKGLKLQAVQ